MDTMRWPVVLALTLGLGAFVQDAEAKSTRIRSHITKRGSYVGSHRRTTPNRSRLDNWSTKGNINPYTGKKGTRKLW